RAVARSLARKETEDAPKPRRRRGGGAGAPFGKAARSLVRRIVLLPAGAYAWASFDHLGWHHHWHSHEDIIAMDYQDDPSCRNSDQLFPHL
ncbi:MAG: hypothetical protein AB7F35_25405, partial [Acetobacteraceae bacterium]